MIYGSVYCFVLNEHVEEVVGDVSFSLVSLNFKFKVKLCLFKLICVCFETVSL